MFTPVLAKAHETSQSRRRAVHRNRPQSAEFRADEEAGRGSEGNADSGRSREASIVHRAGDHRLELVDTAKSTGDPRGGTVGTAPHSFDDIYVFGAGV